MPTPISPDTAAAGRARVPKIEIYSSMLCPYCMMAKQLLATKGVEYEHISVDGHPARRREMMDRSGRHSVPLIFIDNVPVGGFDDIAALDGRGELDGLLGLSSA